MGYDIPENHHGGVQVLGNHERTKEVCVRLDEDDFKTLVSGGTVTFDSDGVLAIIILADIGFGVMENAIDQARRR